MRFESGYPNSCATRDRCSLVVGRDHTELSSSWREDVRAGWDMGEQEVRSRGNQPNAAYASGNHLHTYSLSCTYVGGRRRSLVVLLVFGRFFLFSVFFALLAAGFGYWRLRHCGSSGFLPATHRGSGVTEFHRIVGKRLSRPWVFFRGFLGLRRLSRAPHSLPIPSNTDSPISVAFVPLLTSQAHNTPPLRDPIKTVRRGNLGSSYSGAYKAHVPGARTAGSMYPT